ncbi:hypothetical protein M0R45_008073 [Rubus argutus]|uniref:Uncharacterized protein n=1 Tax=Rubus argutus TaxID=59490 RepID=A0AAW1XZN8_RUBAR
MSIWLHSLILVDIDLSKDHPTSLMVERGNHAFLVAIDYETSLDKLKNILARERPKSRSYKCGHLSDHPVGDRPPHHQEYRIKATSATSVNVPLLDQQGLRNTHGETPLVSHHVETENRFAILASEPYEDHSHVITKPITVPLDNISEKERASA